MRKRVFTNIIVFLVYKSNFSIRDTFANFCLCVIFLCCCIKKRRETEVRKIVEKNKNTIYILTNIFKTEFRFKMEKESKKNFLRRVNEE